MSGGLSAANDNYAPYCIAKDVDRLHYLKQNDRRESALNYR